MQLSNHRRQSAVGGDRRGCGLGLYDRGNRAGRDGWDRRCRGNRNPGGNGCGRRVGSLYRSRLRSGGGRYRRLNRGRSRNSRRGRNRGGCRSWSRGRCGRRRGNHQGLPGNLAANADLVLPGAVDAQRQLDRTGLARADSEFIGMADLPFHPQAGEIRRVGVGAVGHVDRNCSRAARVDALWVDAQVVFHESYHRGVGSAVDRPEGEPWHRDAEVDLIVVLAHPFRAGGDPGGCGLLKPAELHGPFVHLIGVQPLPFHGDGYVGGDHVVVGEILVADVHIPVGNPVRRERSRFHRRVVQVGDDGLGVGDDRREAGQDVLNRGR